MENIKFNPETLQQIIEEKLKFINTNKEKIIEAFLAQTGLHPSECILVERKRHDGGWEWGIVKKSEIWPENTYDI